MSAGESTHRSRPHGFRSGLNGARLSAGSGVADDEDFFARLDEAEILAGDGFDGGGILAQAASGLAERRVVVA